MFKLAFLADDSTRHTARPGLEAIVIGHGRVDVEEKGPDLFLISVSVNESAPAKLELPEQVQDFLKDRLGFTDDDVEAAIGRADEELEKKFGGGRKASHLDPYTARLGEVFDIGHLTPFALDDVRTKLARRGFELKPMAGGLASIGLKADR